MINMVKLQESKGTYFVSILIDIVKDKGWKKGEELIWKYNSDGDVILKKLK